MLESVRRTVMIAFSFVCMSHLLKSSERMLPPYPYLPFSQNYIGNQHSLAPFDVMETSMVFTASRHLWEADSSVNFYRAWQEKPQYCIQDLDFKAFWLYGRPEDVDDFTRLMLTV